MFGSLVRLVVVTVLATTGSLVGGHVSEGAAIASATAPAPAAKVSVKELNLSGIDEDAVEELPEVAPAVAEDAPVEALPDDAAAPASTSTGARVTNAAFSTPAEVADPPSPSAEPTPTPTSTPTTTPTDPVQPAPEPSASATPDEPVDPDVLTGELDTPGFSVLGVTWKDTAGLVDPVIRYRVRQADQWSDWEAVGESDLAPDAGGADDRGDGGRGATDPIVALHADGLQLWAQAAEGRVTGLKAVLIDPGKNPAGTSGQSSATAGAAVIRNAAVLPAAPAAAPAIITRAGWGADESMRTCDADLAPVTRAAAVHHTASTNDYSPNDVPGLLRGFYAYHTRPEAAGGRGWCDIGYNFLVDKFGRVFEGRAGSITKAVVGVHTGGFNSRTIGIAAIGDYSTAAPSGALLEALSQVIAWKFKTFRILAGTAVTMVSGGGASKWPEGTLVTFQTIYGHRDAQLTACPGQYLYDQLPYLRARVSELANNAVYASPTWSLDSFSADSSGISGGGWVLDPESTASLDVVVTIDGVDTVLSASGSRPDLAGPFPGNGIQHGFSFTIPAAGGAHQVCISARNVGNGNDVMFGCDWKTVVNQAPFGSLDIVASTATTIRVAGWALDPDTTGPVTLHVYFRDALTAITANLSRPDVGAAFGKGDNHGFDSTLPASPGDHQVCVYAINQPVGINQLIGCRNVRVGNPPVGVVDSVVAVGSGSVTVSGWAFDPDTADSIGVHFFVDGAWTTATTAATPRADVNGAYKITGAHGYSATFPASAGTHRVCAYAIDATGGSANPEIGCRFVTLVNKPPVGVIDSATATPGTVTLSGWAFDPDTTAPIGVHFFIDGRWTGATTAASSRPDVGAVYGSGANHGYSLTLPMTAGTHRVCAYGIDSAGGPNPEIACRVAVGQ